VLKHKPRGVIDENGHSVSWPDEIILQDAPIGTNIGNGIPFQEWWGVCSKINNAAAMAWLGTYEAMFFNNDQGPAREIDKTHPVNIRCSSSGGNLKAFYLNTQTATHIQLVAYDYQHPELANGQDFYTNPEMFTLPTAINLAGRISKVASGIDVFAPQICRPQGIWIRKTEVIMLSSKPQFWSIADVMDAKWI
jgi:hypothetical protein